ncbi:MAG: toll/interleukin-1 receptor domain-containing protein [Chloroflexi bacterium]|nr:toll/interleukin-1 receptor domain-containing protein [Chloroflexota bacterium]MCC6892915.1 toll/interleukin-1 receptor domain-containing protein [Anaerolineae bacterium]
MQQVFISYSKQDANLAQQIYASLKLAGFNVWSDADLKADDDWEAQIDSALRTSSHCVVLLSPSSIKSSFVTSEYRYFLGRNKPVIPVLVGDIALNDIPERLQRMQMLDLRTSTQSGIERLITALRAPAELPSEDLQETNRKPLKLTLSLNINEFGNEKFQDLITKLNDIGVDEIEVVNVDKAS